jgi:hypothetical protein
MSIEAAPTTIGWMDVAVNLVESYLRLNGYLTLSEIEVQSQNALGGYDTLTDVDIIGFRFPGDVFAAESTDRAESRMLLITDDVLDLNEDRIDVIIGEVKQGEAVFNAGLGRTGFCSRCCAGWSGCMPTASHPWSTVCDKAASHMTGRAAVARYVPGSWRSVRAPFLVHTRFRSVT